MRVNKFAASGIFLAAFSIFSSSLAVSAGEIVNVNGHRYEKGADGRLFPQVRNDWTDLQGVVHTSWVTDYSGAPLLPERTTNFQDKQPIKPASGAIRPQAAAVKPSQGNAGQAAQLDDVTVKDIGDKHYLTINADCLFDFDKSELNVRAEKILGKVGPVLQKYPGHQVEIDGHTDSIGEEAYNQELSERRAATVKSWLVEHGFLQAADASTKGFGETCPVARNTYTDGTDYPQGRQKNRRVEICVSSIAVEKVQSNSGL